MVPLWRHSVEKGRKLGLDIWIYDENSYTSGFAGGHMYREMPEASDHPTRFGFKDGKMTLEKEFGDGLGALTHGSFTDEPHNRPREGSMWPSMWEGIVERYPAESYVLDAYGLMAPFEIRRHLP